MSYEKLIESSSFEYLADRLKEQTLKQTPDKVEKGKIKLNDFIEITKEFVYNYIKSLSEEANKKSLKGEFFVNFSKRSSVHELNVEKAIENIRKWCIKQNFKNISINLYDDCYLCTHIEW